MHNLSLRELANALETKQFSAVELCRHFLKRIDKATDLNAFITVDAEKALIEAARADQLLSAKKGQRLTGIPIAHKDIFCTKDMLSSCGSKMLANFIPPYSAFIVERFIQAGSVMIGKTNMDEFAMGSSNESSYYGAVKNPWQLDCVPGGSSGGSAAAVAASIVPMATGSDTGGSIRQPAAFCGISGIKPTYGLISRYGMIAYASSLDQAGPMARSVEDLAFILEVMAGFDERDSCSLERAVPNYSSALTEPVKKLKIGLPNCFFNPNVDPNLQQAIKDAVLVYEQAGFEIVDMDFKLQEFWIPCYYVIACAEASSNLSRYDGIRFGYRAQNAESLNDLIRKSRDEGFGLEVRRRILTGTYVLSSGYYDAYYLQAQKIRQMIQDEFSEAFQKVDLILGPTTASPAFKIGEISDPISAYLSDRFTVAANLAGLPALSIPVGFSRGLPLGMQLIGPHFSETKLLQAGQFYQQETNWHLQRPSFSKEISE